MAGVKTVILDAGHGGSDSGAVYMGRKEKDDALALTLAVGEQLTRDGIRVLYTRVNDVYDTPLEKAQMGNESGADYFVSIHRNAMPVPGSASGAQVLVYEDSGIPALMAENISRKLAEAGFKDLGIEERPGLIVLRRTKLPAVLVEAGFIDSEGDNEFFDRNFEAVARAIAEGIEETIRAQENERPEYYQVQVGAYRQREPAERLKEELAGKGLPAFLVYDDGLYKVRVGAFLNMDNGANMERMVRAMGYPTVLVKERAMGLS